MAIPGLAPSIDYLAREFAVIRQRAFDLLKLRVGSFRYDALLSTDVVPAIIDVLSWFHEQNAHYFNRAQRNSLLLLADTREAMVPLARAVGYEMRPATSASVAVQVTVDPPQAVPITLRRGARVAVGDLTFEVAEDTIIPAGARVWPDGTTDDLVILVEGTTREESFQSDGSQFQEFTLGQPGVIEGSVSTDVADEVWTPTESLVFIEGTQRGRDTFAGAGVDNQSVQFSLLFALIDQNDEDRPIVLVTPPGGNPQDAERWLQVATFTGAPNEFILSQTVDGVTTSQFGTLAAGAAPLEDSSIDVLYLIAGTQKRYQLTFDPDSVATIRFGDGVFGSIPSAGATVTSTYRTGGGVRGNVPAGAIEATLQGFLPNGATFGVSLNNASAGSGGEAAETVDHARFFAPKFAKSNDRAVTKEDWTTLAATFTDPVFGAPAHVNAYLKQKVPELNTVQVAAWGRDQDGRLATAGESLKAGVKNFLDSRRTITTVVEMVDGRVMIVDVEADITLEPGRLRQVVFADVTTAIVAFFSSSEVLPGVDLSISKLYRSIQDTDGVAYATITKVVCAERITLAVGTGDGLTDLFAGDFLLPEGTSIALFSVAVMVGAQAATDEGGGGFIGDVFPGIAVGLTGNAINYVTGRFSIQFGAPPDTGALVVAEARRTLFAAVIEDLGGSDGLIDRLNSATLYYPILQRATRGVWAGDPHKVIDAFRISTTSQFRGRLPSGVDTLSLVIEDSTGVPQVLTDNGLGALVGAGAGTVSYSTGEIIFTFGAAPTLPVRARWTTSKVDVLLPADYLPFTKGRVFFWGGFDADGLQPVAPVGAQLIAYDDGDGVIAGNVLPGGLLVHETGRAQFSWNVVPPPGPGGGATVVATLTQVPDGVLKIFDFTTGSNLSRSGLDGEGRLRFQLTDLATPGVSFEDAYDNWQGGVHGLSLDRNGDNYLNYTTGVGRITFLVAPAVTAPGTFIIKVTNVAVLLYSAFVFRAKTPSAPGLDAGLFADNNGRFWGPPGSGPVNAYPTDALDHLRGRYKAQLASGVIAAGRPLELTYDTIQGVPPALNITVVDDQIATPGRVALTERAPEVQGLF
jgi:hypothetical protein